MVEQSYPPTSMSAILAGVVDVPEGMQIVEGGLEFDMDIVKRIMDDGDEAAGRMLQNFVFSIYDDIPEPFSKLGIRVGSYIVAKEAVSHDPIFGKSIIGLTGYFPHRSDPMAGGMIYGTGIVRDAHSTGFRGSWSLGLLVSELDRGFWSLQQSSGDRAQDEATLIERLERPIDFDWSGYDDEYESLRAPQ